MPARGFKSGKGNPYNQIKAEMEKARQELAEERLKPTLRDFASKLGDAMLVKLAYTPYKDWPVFAQGCFEWVRTEVPTLAYLYKERLPK